MSDYDEFDSYDNYGDDNEPYFLEPTELGRCPTCGSGLENWGAVSMGDGDLSDEIGCPNCQEAVRHDNTITFIDDDEFIDLSEMFEWEQVESDAPKASPPVDDIPF